MHKKRQRQAKTAAGPRRRGRVAASASAPATRKVSAPRAAAGASRTGGNRKVHAAARRQAILDAALTVFADRGYEAARLDDVAARAGVAKGTLYLYFKDKEALFEALVRGAVSPIIERASEAAAAPNMKAADVLDLFFGMFRREVLGTKRKLLVRLIIAEGPRFPALAEFYYREVVSRGIKLMRAVAERAVERREFTSDAAARFPQLIVAPLMVALIWDGLFSRIDPLDVAGMLRAHRELLTARPRRAAS